MSRLKVRDMQSREEAEETDVPVVEEEEDSESEVESDADSELEKDEAEEELEHLVFGDSAGFRERLRSFPQEDTAAGEDDENITGLEGLDDAQVGQASNLAIYRRFVQLTYSSFSSQTQLQRVIFITHPPVHWKTTM